jgi:hypothetical protein
MVLGFYIGVVVTIVIAPYPRYCGELLSNATSIAAVLRFWKHKTVMSRPSVRIVVLGTYETLCHGLDHGHIHLFKTPGSACLCLHVEKDASVFFCDFLKCISLLLLMYIMLNVIFCDAQI